MNRATLPATACKVPYVPTIRGGRAWVALLAAMVVAGYALLGWSEVLADFGGDSAAYWLTAQGWSPWRTPSALQADFAAASTYPPLYPLVLAWLGGGSSLVAAHAVTVALLLGGMVALAWFCRRAGLDGLATTGITVTFACCAGVRLEGLDLHSEPLYLLLSMAALGLGVRLRERPSLRMGVALGLLVAGALLTRAAGVTLLAAVGVMALRERRGAWVVAVLPGVLAMAINAWLQKTQQRYTGELLGQYSPEHLLATLVRNLEFVPASWTVAIAGQGASTVALWALCLFGLAALAAGTWRAWQGHFDGSYFVLYLALAVIWPYPAETARLLVPVLGLAIAEVCLAARAIWDCRPTLPLRQLWWFVLLFALGDTLRFGTRFLVPLPADLAPYRHTLYWQLPDPEQALVSIGFMHGALQLLARLDSLVPAGECVFAIKPTVVTAFGQRPARTPPPAKLSDAEFETALAAGGCRYLLLLRLVSPSYPDRLYPSERLAGKLQTVARAPNSALPDLPAAILVARLPPP